MTEAPLVSVLIPCYNAERWIKETLDSVLNQTWTNFEVIVVDDGSTDASASIVRSFGDTRIHLYQQVNRGQTAALNTCLEHASGDFVQYLDADDVIGPEKIGLQIRRLLDNPGCIATAEWDRFHTSVSEAEFRPYAVWKDMGPIDWLVESWADGGGMLFPALWLIPKSIVDQIGPWREDLTLNNDAEYFTRAVLASRKVLFVEGARCYYRSGLAGSLSGSRSKSAWESQFKVLEACTGYLLNAEDSERTRRACSMLWQRAAHGAFPYVPGLANSAMRKARQLYPEALQPDGGKLFHLTRALTGWRVARILQRLSGRA